MIHQLHRHIIFLPNQKKKVATENLEKYYSSIGILNEEESDFDVSPQESLRLSKIGSNSKAIFLYTI